MLKGGLILALAAASTLALAVADARPPTGKCRSPQGSVVTINRSVVAYELRRSARSGDALSGRLIGCLRRTGNKVQLSGSTFGEYWFDRPARAVKVRGSVVGFAALLDPGYGSSLQTQISFVDMRRPRARVSIPAAGLVGSLDFTIASGRGGLTARRAAAWIQCPDLDERMNADPRPNCVRAGLSENAVLAVGRGSRRAVRIASDRSIDPRSVRVRGSRVSWVRSGRRISAPLPG